MADGKKRVVVVGSGVSGMSASLSAIDRGAHVTLISHGNPYRSGSASVRDGVSAAIGSASGDSPAIHAEDTLRCGDFLAGRPAVERMCGKAPEVAWLASRFGMVFDRAGDGGPRLWRAAGSTFARTMRSGRSTGQRLLRVLAGQIMRAGASDRLAAFFGMEFLSLVVDESGRARGVVAQDLRNMQIRAFPADAVIICTGGYPAIFGRHTSSSVNDGSAMVSCWEQGAALANPEFVEISPFSIAAPGKPRSVPDSVLSCGGVWVERDGRPWRFLEEMHPAHGGAVPADVALRSLIRACSEAGVRTYSARLDLTNLDHETISGRMPFIVDICDDLGIDPTCETIETTPAVRNSLGGLWVRPDHSASIEGLYAAGSACCLYHGACALGGNRLPASVHGGLVAGASAAEAAGSRDDGAPEAPQSLLAHAVERETDNVARISAKQGGENAWAISTELGALLFDKALLVKDDEELARAAGRVAELTERLSRAQLIDRSEWSNAELSLHRRLERRLALAGIYIRASIARQESRGFHRKPSSPERDDRKWAATTRVLRSKGEPVLDHAERLSCEPGRREY
ncbi:MAG: FAD-binding protein [Proteobacteria bacterium]|nr:FAD-binding protein [Pseudomonadota bacterium]